jgi:hypothetical protein
LSTVLLDQNFNRRISAALRRALPGTEFLTAYELGIAEMPDWYLMERAATDGWTILTHDAKTFPPLIGERLAAELPPARVILVPKRIAIAEAIEDIVVILTIATDRDWQNNLIRVPIR